MSILQTTCAIHIGNEPKTTVGLLPSSTKKFIEASFLRAFFRGKRTVGSKRKVNDFRLLDKPDEAKLMDSNLTLVFTVVFKQIFNYWTVVNHFVFRRRQHFKVN